MNHHTEPNRQSSNLAPEIAAQNKTTHTLPVLPSRKSRPKGSTARKMFWLGLLVVLAVTGGFVRLRKPTQSAEVTFASHSEVRQVSVTKPERATNSDVTLPATMQAYQATDLFARADGYLKAWNYDIGAQVKKGDILATIETPELDQELLQAVALLKQGQAEHQQAIAELEEATSDITLADANVVKAKANVEFSNSQVQRFANLLPTRAVAREEYEEVVRQRDARQAELESANAELARRKTNLGTRKAIIESREAAIGNRRANVKRLQDLTGFQKLVAPFDGVITRRNAEVGMLVTSGSNAGTRPLFSVAQIDTLRVHASVPQSSALNIKPGDHAQITVPEQPGQVYDATVSRTASAVDPTSRSLLVEVELPNPNDRLLPGVYAQVRFQSTEQQAHLLVQSKALQMRSTGPHVVVVTPDNSLRLQKLGLGRDFGTTVEVLSGLTGHEQLVLNPTDDLHDGESVQIATADQSDVQVAHK